LPQLFISLNILPLFSLPSQLPRGTYATTPFSWAVLALSTAPLLSTSWSLPSVISPVASVGTSSVVPINYSVAVDADGNSYAVWLEANPDSPTDNVIKSAILPFGASVWGSYATLGGTLGSSAANAIISAGPAGSAIAIWSVVNAMTSEITSQAAVYNNGSWAFYDFGLANTSACSVAMNLSGDALILLEQGPTTFSVLAIPYLNGIWGGSQTLNSPSQSNTTPAIAFNRAGDGIAVWQQYDGTTYTVESSIYKSGLWTAAPLFGDTSSTFAGNMYPQIAIDLSGNGTAAWNQASALGYNAVSASFNAATGSWSSSTLLDSGVAANTTFPIFYQAVAMDNQGDAIVGWSYDNPLISFVKTATLPRNGTTWTTTVILESHNVPPNYNGYVNPSVILDAKGDAALCWLTVEVINGKPFGSITGAYKGIKDNSWTLKTLYTSPLTSAPAPQRWLSSNSAGYVTAAWGLELIIQSSHLSFTTSPPAPPITPPTHFKGKVIKNIFPLREECVQQLTWKPSKDPCVVGYRLYSEGKLIKTIPQCGPFLVNIEGVGCRQTKRYRLVAFDFTGATSKPVFATVR
jgi:hypothetical protein